MKEIKTEITINASPEKVWDILTDINKWQDWNPIITQASGESSLGSKLTITMCGKDGKAAQKYMPVVSGFDKPKLFSWRAKMLAGFIFTNDKVIELEAIEAGTKLIHKELFDGLMLKMMCKMLDSGVPPMLDSMNQALKKEAENK